MPTQTPSTGRPAATRSAMILSPPISRSPVMQASNAPTPGTTSPSACCGRTGVGGHLDLGADPLQRPLRRPQVAGAVVENNDGLRCHRVPLVDGTPVTRGSNSTAWRSARATALYCASVMWCGSRP